MTTQTHKDAFQIGRITITPGALGRLNLDDIWDCLNRHVRGDWGDCELNVARQNDYALDKDLRLRSVYHDRNSTEFWIITEWDRSVTTVLLAEY